jgi:hypothetical protein
MKKRDVVHSIQKQSAVVVEDSMLRQIERLRTWDTSGHVCRLCRYRLNLQNHRRPPRALYATSNSSGAIGQDDDNSHVDNWHDNFNNLDANLQHLNRNRAGESSSADAQKEKQEEDVTRRSFKMRKRVVRQGSKKSTDELKEKVIGRVSGSAPILAASSSRGGRTSRQQRVSTPGSYRLTKKRQSKALSGDEGPKDGERSLGSDPPATQPVSTRSIMDAQVEKLVETVVMEQRKEPAASLSRVASQNAQSKKTKKVAPNEEGKTSADEDLKQLTSKLENFHTDSHTGQPRAGQVRKIESASRLRIVREYSASKQDNAATPSSEEMRSGPFGLQSPDAAPATDGLPEIKVTYPTTPNFSSSPSSNTAAAALARLHPAGSDTSNAVVESEASAITSDGKESKPKKPKGTSKKPAASKKPIVQPAAPRSAGRQRAVGRKSSSKRVKSTSSESSTKITTMSLIKGTLPGQEKKNRESTLSASEREQFKFVEPRNLTIAPLDIPQPPVPQLEYNLDRVLFNKGVYQLQDPHSRVYNFDPYLQRIMPVVEFDYNALKEYKTSSQDVMLAQLAREHGKRYIGSTSSMTGTLGHFHYLLSAFRPVNVDMLSKGFPGKLDTFTQINRAPNAIFLRWKDGRYAVDADKEYDNGNVLMMLGKSMEKLLTLPTSEFERYRKSDSRSISESERQAPESFCYTTMGDFLMRSQLDAYDPRLPGTGMFDLKTRAVVSVRMNTRDFEPMTGYEIHTLQGQFGSYEREYYDMIRSTMLKYMLQVRMGRMDGIFVAYHNVERIFGFEYISLADMDRALHGQVDPCLGDQEFKVSLDLMNKVFDMATAKYPNQSLRFHFEAVQEKLNGSDSAMMWVFAEPMSDPEIDKIQSKSKAKIVEFEKTMLGHDPQEHIQDASEEHPSVSGLENSVPSELTTTNAAEDDTSARSSEASAGLNHTANRTIRSADGSREIAPLFAACILCVSKINGGDPVARPERLQPEDTWKVEYILSEPEGSESMWARYEQMKARRKAAFAKFDSGEDEDEPETTARGKGPKQKKDDRYIEFLKSMSKQGREFRDRVDEMEAGKTPVVVGQPFREESETVGDVGEYMSWLYRGTE